MMISNFRNRDQSLIGIIIVLVVVGLISGGLYYYFSGQVSETPEIITEKQIEEKITKPEEVSPEEKLPKEERVKEGPVSPITVSNYYNICWDYDCSAKYPPYPKLIESLKPSVIDKCQECYLQATGEINIIVVFLYVYDPLPDEYINILKNLENDVRSFKYAAKWYKEEARKRNVNLNININFSGSQFKVPEEYIIHTSQESLTKNLTEYVKTGFPQFSDYDVIVPFYYGSYNFSFTNHATSKNSFEIFSTQYLPGFLYPDFKEGSTNYSEAFVHELTHLFGATDKYTCLDTSSESCSYAKENGIGCWIESEDPNQLGKDIMCHRAPKYDGEWVFVRPPLNELIIIEATTKEIGWYDADGDGIFEVSDPCPFNSANDCL